MIDLNYKFLAPILILGIYSRNLFKTTHIKTFAICSILMLASFVSELFRVFTPKVYSEKLIHDEELRAAFNEALIEFRDIFFIFSLTAFLIALAIIIVRRIDQTENDT